MRHVCFLAANRGDLLEIAELSLVHRTQSRSILTAGLRLYQIRLLSMLVENCED